MRRAVSPGRALTSEVDKDSESKSHHTPQIGLRVPTRVYRSRRVADAYAYSRPPVHQHIVEAMRRQLGTAAPLRTALDVGCGAGLSTAALAPIARYLVGLEPSSTMLTHGRHVAPQGQFVIGGAERLPFADETFDLVTAAGSLNYADTNAFLPEAARVLRPTGVLAIYDFSAGRRFRDDRLLDEWYDVFEQRYPAQAGYALDVRRLPFAQFGLRLDAYHDLEVAVPMSIESYLRYAMSETGVELAIAAGVQETDIRDWCQRTLEPVFADQARDVVFDAYIAYVSRDGRC